MFDFSDLCICVVFYNGDLDIEEKVKMLSIVSKHVLIIDNHSLETYQEVFLRMKKNNYNVSVISNKLNMGVAYALNQGLKFANEKGCKLLLTLDQDSTINEETIKKLIQSIDPKNRIVSVGPYYGEKITDKKYSTNVNYLITSGNIVYVPVILKIGGYNSKLFIDCVDIDFSFNILCHGFKQKKIGGTFLKHKIGEYENSRILKIKYKSHSPNRYYYMYRNNIYIYKQYFRKCPQQCIKLFLSLLKNFFDVVFIQREKLAKIKYSFLGIRDGVRNEFKNI